MSVDPRLGQISIFLSPASCAYYPVAPELVFDLGLNGQYELKPQGQARGAESGRVLANDSVVYCEERVNVCTRIELKSLRQWKVIF